MSNDTQLPTMQTVAVLRSEDFCVIEGVAEGEGITFADELVMDDIYQQPQSATRVPLCLALRDGEDGFVIDPSTAVGKPSNIIYLDSCITMMGSDSTTYEVLVLVEVEDAHLKRHICCRWPIWSPTQITVLLVRTAIRQPPVLPRSHVFRSPVAPILRWHLANSA